MVALTDVAGLTDSDGRVRAVNAVPEVRGRVADTGVSV
jgi:hypothetical protein